MIAMRQRQHRLGGGAERGGDAGHNLDRQLGGAHRLHFLTAAADHLPLLRAAVGDLGPVLLTDEHAEDSVGAVNRAATLAALRACTALRAELAALATAPEVVDAAVGNVLAGTALDFPPDPGNGYTAALLRELAAPAAVTAINTPAAAPRSVGGAGHPAARP